MSGFLTSYCLHICGDISNLPALFQIYGHTAANKGMTCNKACAELSLGCVTGLEGSNNCACSHMDDIKQTFSCSQDLSKQSAKASKAFVATSIHTHTHTHTHAMLYIVRGTQVPCASHINISIVTQNVFSTLFHAIHNVQAFLVQMCGLRKYVLHIRFLLGHSNMHLRSLIVVFLFFHVCIRTYSCE